MSAQNEFKVLIDGLEVKYEIQPQVYESKDSIQKGLSDIDVQLAEINSKVDEYNTEIDRLTNNADGFDYSTAVVCGVISGIIDSFLVGQWNLSNAYTITNEKVNAKVLEFAKSQGFKGDKLDKAIAFLENKFPLPGDNNFHNVIDELNGKEIITTTTHHLDDFCHHPTLIGLICCVLVQFTGSSVYSDKLGNVHNIPITVNEYGNFVGKNPVTKIFSGIINWFFTVSKVMANRKGHLMSDIAGSHSSAGRGSGIPGNFLSLMKELGALPCFKDTNFNENLRRAFQNGIGTGNKQVDLGVFNDLFAGASSKLDFRTEMAFTYELKRQSIPIMINEILVRAIFFIRRFWMELKTKGEIFSINWRNIIPYKNRTLTRMLTISVGTFTATDIADAAIRGAKNSGGNGAVFLSQFILRINFVGIGRFAIAIGSDVKMGIERNNLRDERIKLLNEELNLMNAKTFYLQAGVWVQVQELDLLITECENNILKTVKQYNTSQELIRQDFEIIDDKIKVIRELNPNLAKKMKRILR